MGGVVYGDGKSDPPPPRGMLGRLRYEVNRKRGGGKEDTSEPVMR